MIKKIYWILSLFFICPLWASSECISYKINPKITIKTPDWVKEVVQPLETMDLWHGNVIATMVDNYEIVADITSIEDGFCIGIKQVDAEIGYSDFIVQVDIRHSVDSCSYNAVLSHEDQHIREYLSVIDDFKPELHDVLYSAANSVMPVFISDMSDADWAIEQLNNKLQSHPELILVKQKIKAAEEIRNKKIDQNDTGAALKKCMN